MYKQPDEPNRPMTPEEFFGMQQQRPQNIAQPKSREKQPSEQNKSQTPRPQEVKRAQVKKVVPPQTEPRIADKAKAEKTNADSLQSPQYTINKSGEVQVQQMQQNIPVQQMAETKTQQVITKKTCPYCGEVVAANVLKCKFCGEWLIKREGKSWVKTMLFCAYLGLFGVHNFYNNKIGIAVVQLVLSLTIIGLFISIPWLIIDWLLILHDVYTDANGLKLSRKPTLKGCAALCALGILGGAGLHRFYTKQYALAWLQMITLGGFWVWTIIDLMLICCGKFKDAQGNYIRG